MKRKYFHHAFPEWTFASHFTLSYISLLIRRAEIWKLWWKFDNYFSVIPHRKWVESPFRKFAARCILWPKRTEYWRGLLETCISDTNCIHHQMSRKVIKFKKVWIIHHHVHSTTWKFTPQSTYNTGLFQRSFQSVQLRNAFSLHLPPWQ